MTYRKFVVLCLILLSALSAAPSASADPVCTALTAGSASVGDVFISSVNADENFDSAGAGFTGIGKHNNINYTLIHVDTSFIPAGATIASATVTLQQTGGTGLGATVDVDQILGGWNPDTVTWDDFTAGFDPNPVATFVTGTGAVSFDLTALTQAWVSGKIGNYGILLEQSTGLMTYDFSASENLQIFNVCYTDAPSPALSLLKTVSTTGACPGGTMITVAPGTQVTSCYAVTNTGDATISGVVVNDSGTAVTIGDLAPGATGSGSATATVTTTSDTAAVATGTVAGTAVTSAQSDALVTVLTSSLSLQKTVSLGGLCPGSSSVSVTSGLPVTYCYAVTNSGQLPISGVVVSDGGVAIPIGDLAPGASGSGSTTVVLLSNTSSPAVASGTDSAGESVTSPQSSAMVDVVSGSLGLDPSCESSGVYETAQNPGWPNHESATCASGDGLTLAQALAFCGADVSYFDYTCTDFEDGTRAWTGSFGCCVPAGGPSCSDGILNGTETDVDCGGQCPQACSTGQKCNGDTDCISDYCVAGRCAIPAVLNSTCTSDGNNVTLYSSGFPDHQDGTCEGGFEGFTIFQAAATCPGGQVKYFDYTCTDFALPPPYQPQRTWESDYACCVPAAPALAIQKTVSTTGTCPGEETVTVLVGTGVTYCYTVTNTGDTTVTGVTVDDAGTIVSIGDLPPGGSGSASSPFTALQDTTTPAVATGTVPATGGQVSSPPDTATVDVVSPALTTTVTVSTDGTCPGQKVVTVEAGTGVTWCYTVTNTGDTPVSGIVVTDNQYGVVPGAPFSLNPGDSETLSLGVSASTDVTLTASAAGTATVTGTPVVSPQDSAVVHVVSPSIDIDVTVSVSGSCPGADSVTVPAGTTVVYCYAVTNNGDDVLANVVVTDGAGNVVGTIGDLAPGATVTLESGSNVVQGDVTVPGTANGTDVFGYPVSSTDTALVHALFPSLQIQKTVSLDGTCPGVELVTVLSGTNVTYCYLVTNSGDTVVTNVSVVDNGTTVPVGTLVPGGSSVVSASVTATTNMDTFAVAQGTNPYTGQPVDSPPDDAVVVVVHPTLAIDKTVSLDGTCPGQDSVTVLPGTGVTYCYVVTNTGDTTIANVAVTDTQAGVYLPVGTLAAGASATVSAPISVGTVDLDTFAYASGTDTATWTHVQSAPDDAIVDVIHPALSISVTVSTSGACPGQKVVDVESGTGVTWCYVITNTGDVAVNGVTASDDTYGAVPGGGVDLGVGQSVTLSRPETATTDVAITATATGTDAVLGSPVVSNPDSAAVNVVHPVIGITVTVSTTGTCPGVPSLTVPAGTSVTYCYTVTNNGDDTLDNVVVTDDSGHTITTIAQLPAGASQTFTAAPVVELSNVTVPGNANATDQYGFPVSASGHAVVNVLFANPGIVKTGPATVTASSSGAPLTYTLTVTNSGQTTAVHPVVTDVIPSGETYVSVSTTSGSCSFAGGTLTCALADLAPGATATITVHVSVTALNGTITNTATVTSSTPDSDTSNNTSSTTTQITNGGATRTQGFYATHPNFTQACLTSLGGTMNIGWFVIGNYDAGGPVNNTPLAYAMGVLNGNISKYINGVHRSAIEHDKMIAAQQLVAAICNQKYLGTAPSFDINGMIAAMAGTNDALIMSYEGQADAFNNNGDNVNTPINPGPANPKYPWDDPTDPYM